MVWSFKEIKFPGAESLQRNLCGCMTNRVEKKHDFLFIKIWIFFMFDFFKSGIYDVIKYLTIRLSGVNTATQV